MLTFTEAQLMAWLAPVFWPFLRVLALFTAAPVFSTRAIPLRARIALAFFVALCAQAALPPQAIIDLNSRAALGTVVQQVGIGLAMGFAVRIIFTAIELAGEIIGLQMGLNFASFFDPMRGTQVSAVERFFGNLALLLFIVLGGHLMVLLAIVKSFMAFPVDGNFLHSLTHLPLHTLGSQLFASALWLALPMMTLLTFVNLTLGIISRVAPQMNIYAVGFPVTLTAGLLAIAAVLPMLEQPLLALLEQAVQGFVSMESGRQM